MRTEFSVKWNVCAHFYFKTVAKQNEINEKVKTVDDSILESGLVC